MINTATPSSPSTAQDLNPTLTTFKLKQVYEVVVPTELLGAAGLQKLYAHAQFQAHGDVNDESNDQLLATTVHQSLFHIYWLAIIRHHQGRSLCSALLRLLPASTKADNALFLTAGILRAGLEDFYSHADRIKTHLVYDSPERFMKDHMRVDRLVRLVYSKLDADRDLVLKKDDFKQKQGVKTLLQDVENQLVQEQVAAARRTLAQDLVWQFWDEAGGQGRPPFPRPSNEELAKANAISSWNASSPVDAKQRRIEELTAEIARLKAPPLKLLLQPSDPVPISTHSGAKGKTKTLPDDTYIRYDLISRDDEKALIKEIEEQGGPWCVFTQARSQHKTPIKRLKKLQSFIVGDGWTTFYYYKDARFRVVQPFTPRMKELALELRKVFDMPYLNSCVLHKWRNETDELDAHQDKTWDWYPGQGVVTVTLGAVRDVCFYKDKTEVARLALPSRSAYTIGWRTNQIYKHAIPPVSNKTGVRYSLTFRSIVSVYNVERNLTIWRPQDGDGGGAEWPVLRLKDATGDDANDEHYADKLSSYEVVQTIKPANPYMLQADDFSQITDEAQANYIGSRAHPTRPACNGRNLKIPENKGLDLEEQESGDEDDDDAEEEEEEEEEEENDTEEEDDSDADTDYTLSGVHSGKRNAVAPANASATKKKRKT